MSIPIIPNKAVFMLMFVAWSSVLTVPMLFPFVGYMTVDFGMADNTDEAGYYAGFLAGAFMLGRAISSTCWGVIADRYGKVEEKFHKEKFRVLSEMRILGKNRVVILDFGRVSRFFSEI